MNTKLELDVWSQHETQQPVQRLVFLGASNLTRAFPTAVSVAQESFGGPLSIFAAHGLGRSYGLEAGNLGKKFPGIFFSGLWRALAAEKSAPTSAWITDIGNDLGYEARVEDVLAWVTGCVDRLTSLDAKIVITDLPIAPLNALSERRFRFFRSLFFPRCRLTREELIDRAVALSAGIHALGEARKIPIFPARNEWYGLDPIHPRRRYLAPWWRELMSAQSRGSRTASALRSGGRWHWYLALLAPETWAQFGRMRSASQPNGRLWDGSTIALY